MLRHLLSKNASTGRRWLALGAVLAISNAVPAHAVIIAYSTAAPASPFFLGFDVDTVATFTTTNLTFPNAGGTLAAQEVNPLTISTSNATSPGSNPFTVSRTLTIGGVAHTISQSLLMSLAGGVHSSTFFIGAPVSFVLPGIGTVVATPDALPFSIGAAATVNTQLNADFTFTPLASPGGGSPFAAVPEPTAVALPVFAVLLGIGAFIRNRSKTVALPA